MPIGDIGELYDETNVLVGSAVGFVSPVGTPDPADSLTVFDPAVWLAATAVLKATTPPTAGTFLLTLSGGPFAAPVNTGTIAFNAAATAVASALQAILPTGYTAIVSGGAGGPYSISFSGPLGGQIVTAIDGTALTGGTGATTITTSPWLSAGATEQGWQVNWNPSTADIRIDEQPTPVDEQLDSATLQFVANLSEDTLTNWGYALNADKTIVAPTTTVFGKSILTPNPVLKRFKVCLESQNKGSMPRRFIVPKMTCAANVGATFKRSGTQRLIPVTFTSICKFSQIQVIDITSNHT